MAMTAALASRSVRTVEDMLIDYELRSMVFLCFNACESVFFCVSCVWRGDGQRLWLQCSCCSI